MVERTVSDKVLKDKAFEISGNRRYDGYGRGSMSMVYKLFDEKSAGTGAECLPNQQLADKLHEQLLENLEGKRCILLLKRIFGVPILLICS